MPTPEERSDAQILRINKQEAAIVAIEGSLTALVGITEEISKALELILRSKPVRTQEKLSVAEMEALSWLVESRALD
jgi:hypothetical protein